MNEILNYISEEFILRLIIVAYWVLSMREVMETQRRHKGNKQ